MQALAKTGKFKCALRRNKRIFQTAVLTTFPEKWLSKLIILLNSISNVFVLFHPLCLILLFYLKLLQQQISKPGIIIIFAWESLGSTKANNEKTVLCRLHPEYLHKVGDDKHTSELTSHQLPWGLSVSLPPLSVCSLTSVTAEKRSVQSLFSFSILFFITIHFSLQLPSTLLLHYKLV